MTLHSLARDGSGMNKQSVKKRLINFRGTNDFARVEVKKNYGPLWQSCNPSPFEQTIQATRFIRFTTPTRMNFSTGNVLGAPLFYVTGLTVPGINTTTSGGAWQPTKAFKPVSFEKSKPPCPPKSTFKEMSFEEFTKMYAAQNAGKYGSNAIPMESK